MSCKIFKINSRNLFPVIFNIFTLKVKTNEVQAGLFYASSLFTFKSCNNVFINSARQSNWNVSSFLLSLWPVYSKKYVLHASLSQNWGAKPQKARCRLSLPCRQIHSKWPVIFTHWHNNPVDNLLVTIYPG